MSNTIAQSQSTLELWKNTALGQRWIICFDLQGRETTRVVQPESTFTLSTFERQINQERAALPEMDLFRDGTFVLMKESDETVVDEVKSPSSMTDAEITQFVNDVMFVDGKESKVKAQAEFLEVMLEDITSVDTVRRLLAAFDEAGAAATITKALEKKQKSLIPNAPVEREVVSTSPDRG